MPRFTIRQLMIVIGVTACGLALVKNYTLPTVSLLYILGLGLFAWLPAHGRSRVASWGFFASAAWLNLSMLFYFAFYPVFHNSVFLFLGSLVFVAIVPGVGLAWVASRPLRSQRLRAAGLVIALTAIPCSMIAYRWPLHLAFYLSSPGLNRLADRIESGGKVIPGEWAGIYRVWGSMKDSRTGAPVLVIDPDRRGIFGFCRHSKTPPYPSDQGDQFNGGRWYAIDQD